MTGSVRIIGGEWRGRRLRIPAGTGARPTPDRIRETVFNWLGPAIAGQRCLDLFAGTGAFGFEALSRGAREVVMVERDPAMYSALEASAALLHADGAVLIRGDAAALLAAADDAPAKGHGRPSLPAGDFDLIVLDPPYGDPIGPLLDAAVRRLSPGGCVYVERSAADGLPPLEGLRWHRRAAAGRVEFGLAVAG